MVLKMKTNQKMTKIVRISRTEEENILNTRSPIGLDLVDSDNGITILDNTRGEAERHIFARYSDFLHWALKKFEKF